MVSEQQTAQVLVDALSYMQKFSGHIMVVKYGGSAMENEEIKKSVLQDIAVLKSVGIKVVIVHGGGKEINRWLDKAKIKSQFKNGLRVTDEDTLEVVQMVLCGKVNKDLVGYLGEHQVKAVGLSGKDGQMIKVEQNTDYGYVGTIKEIDPTLINSLLELGYTPVISSIGVDDAGQGYNVNADDVATEVARSLNASKLVFLTDQKGVLSNVNNPNSLIHHINETMANNLIEQGVIEGGMAVKIKNCIAALDKIEKIHILDGREPHSMIIEIFTAQGIGTEISK
ncbi:MAG: acetylglutamate kinase [Erysipelotrichaceae bacterium]|nr:acetylglutamate kinase [Erysipelotrichaceae bacterium]MDD3809417.1 acetylglutamate kinase [Erysipelotrichaceae bacterium]